MISSPTMTDTPTPPSPGHDLLVGVKKIETIARGAILSNGHVLLCRDLNGGYSYLPGGHVEPGESASEALAREMIEEAGVPVAAGALAFVAESRFIQNGKPKHEITLVFHVEHQLSASEPVPSCEGHIEFWWADLATIIDQDLRPNSAKAWLATLDASASSATALWISERLHE